MCLLTRAARTVWAQVGYMLYGAGSKSVAENDPMSNQFGFPDSTKTIEVHQMPDALPASGNLSLYRCSCCSQYVQKAEFEVECQYHPGKYANRGHGHWSWSCCGAIDDKQSAGCRRKTTHTEDEKFSAIVRSMGCEIPEDSLRAQSRWLAKQFPGAYSDGYLTLEVKLKGGAGESVNLRVLAPPMPSVAAVKTLLHAADSRFAPGKTELATTIGGTPLLDSAALATVEGLQATGVSITAGCTRALVLYVLQHVEQHLPGGASGGAVTPVADRKDWVKVPLKWGDSVQKLSLKYDLPVATIKTANNIVGSEIEAWRDELWLPPSAELGQAARRPQNKQEEFIWLLRGGEKGAGMPDEYRGAGAVSVAARDRPPTPDKAEVEVYLSMNDGDVEAAVAEWKADTDWEDANAPLCAPSPAPPPPIASHSVVVENPMNAMMGRTASGTAVVAADRTLPTTVAKPNPPRGGGDDDDEWSPGL